MADLMVAPDILVAVLMVLLSFHAGSMSGSLVALVGTMIHCSMATPLPRA